MSYDRMDHAGWVERNIAASKRYKPTAADRRRMADRRGWFAAPDILNPFHRRAFTILGIVGGGIYNAPIEWDSVRWEARFIILNWRGELSTYDFSGLTNAVLLAHDAGIRLGVAPKMRWLEITLHQRVRRQEQMSSASSHPSMEAAVASHRARFPAGHHIHLEADAALRLAAPAEEAKP